MKIDLDEIEYLRKDFEVVNQDFSEILLSVGNCDLLHISDETAIFNLRTLHHVSNLLAKIEREIVTEQSGSHESN